MVTLNVFFVSFEINFEINNINKQILQKSKRYLSITIDIYYFDLFKYHNWK